VKKIVVFAEDFVYRSQIFGAPLKLEESNDSGDGPEEKFGKMVKMKDHKR
jgi:hypothetical protein